MKVRSLMATVVAAILAMTGIAQAHSRDVHLHSTAHLNRILKVFNQHFFTARLSAYVADGRSHTALGVPSYPGVAAVDPRVIPFGTIIHVPGYGSFRAGDTGGAIHGSRIDLGMATTRQCMNFGRRSLNVSLSSR